ncbi:MAG: hypothetical protein RIG62_21165 [Cyclobacteriaceae bacterium]
MKFLYLLPLVALSFLACQPEEEELPLPTPAQDPNFIDFEIVQSISLEDEEHAALSRIIVKFNYPMESEVAIGVDSVKYRAVFEGLTSPKVDFSDATYTWNEDLTELLVEPKLNLPPDAELYLTVMSGWERFMDGEWAPRFSTSFFQALEIDPLPAILDAISITEEEAVNIFTIPEFSTHLPEDTEINGFKPFIKKVSLLHNQDTLASTYQPKEEGGYKIIPASFLPYDYNKNLKIEIIAQWKKEIDGVWQAAEKFDKPQTETLEVEFETSFKDISVDFIPRGDQALVSVYYNPSVAFNYEMGKPLLTNLNVRPNYTRVRLEDSNALSLAESLSWNENYTSVKFQKQDNLPESEAIKFVVNVQWEQWVDDEWISLGPDYETLHEETFNTNSTEASELIDVSKYAYSYPLAYQVNFLKGETNQGYIKLQQIDSETEALIDNTSAAELFAVFSNNKQTYNREVPLTYNAGEKMFGFSIPDDLLNNDVFTLELYGHDGTKAVLLSKLYFASSAHDTFLEKVNAHDLISGFRRPLREGVHELGQTYLEGDPRAGELFDKAEIEQGLVIPEAVLSDDRYFHDEIHPLIYDGIERGELSLTWRDGFQYGIIPEKAVYIRQYPSDQEISYSDFIQSKRPYITNAGAFIYNLTDIYEKDYADIRSQISAIPEAERSEWMNTVMSTSFPSIPAGDYAYVLKYTLPGTRTVTSEVSMKVNNPVE